MTRTLSNGKLIVPVASVVTVTMFFVLVGCVQRDREPDFTRARQRLHSEFLARLEDLSTAHRSGNAVAHLQATTRALRLLNSTSIRALLPEIDELSATIAREGLRPYQSITVDLAYRLGRLNRPETQAQFTALARAALGARDKERADARSRMVSLIRVRGMLRYRQYDENTTHAIATLLLSEFGRSQIQRGQTAFDIARTTAMLWECQPAGTRDSTRSQKAKENCRRFMAMVADKLGQSGQSGLLPEVRNDLAGGTRVKTFACFESTDLGNQLIENMEAYTACLASEGTSPSRWVVDGASIASGWSGTPPQMPGYQYVDSKETVLYGPNGNTGTQVEHHYTDGSGGTATVTHFSTIVDGKESTGTHIVTDDGQGNIHQETQNDKGEVISSFDQHADGTASSYEKHDDGSATSVETDANGVSTIEHVDSQGNVTTGTVDSSGNCTGSACTASTPVGEEGMASNCNLHGNLMDERRGETTDPLGPYIYPGPDSPVGTAYPMLACIASSLGTSSNPSACPPSVALCLEPPPDGSCGCGKPISGGGSMIFPSGRCNAIQCADGSCNPETGTCSSSSGGGILGGLCPGIQPQPPPIKPPIRDVRVGESP